MAQYDFRGDTLCSWALYRLVLERIGVIPKLGLREGSWEAWGK